MKQILNKLFLFGILGSFVLLYSCGGDDPEEPTVAVPTISMTSPTGDNVTITEDTNTASILIRSGEVISFSFSVGALGGINAVQVSGAGLDSTFAKGSTSIADGATTATISFGGSFTGADGATAQFTVRAVDDIGTGQFTDYTVNIEIDGTPAKSLTAQLLFVPNANGDIQDSKTFFSSTVAIDDKNTFSVDDVQASAVEVNSIDIDFGFFQGVSTAINIASPSNYAAYDLTALGWTALNQSDMKLTTLDATSFIERTTVEQIQTEYDAAAGDPSANLSGLTVGNVIAMRTDADKTGGSKLMLVLIKAQVDANMDGDFTDVGDYIELEVLIEE